jgi:hypothetical protein
LETPDGPVFESNAIARYGMLSFYACLFCTFIRSRHLLLFWFAAVARSGENSLFGSSPIDQVCVVATIFILIYGISLS